MAELEALMAGMRAREYKTDLVSKHGGSQVAIMQERNRILEEQVRAGCKQMKARHSCVTFVGCSHHARAHPHSRRTGACRVHTNR